MDKIGEDVRRRTAYLGPARDDDPKEEEKDDDPKEEEEGESNFNRDSLPSVVNLEGEYVKHAFQFAEGNNFIVNEMNFADGDSENFRAFQQFTLTGIFDETEIAVNLMY